VHFDTKDKGTPCRTDVITHLSCVCGGTDTNSTYRQCLVSTHPSTTFFTGAYTSFVNREVAKWLEQRPREGVTEVGHTNCVGRTCGTQLTSSIHGTVVFDLTLFNEVTQSDDILTNIRASVIDSCIEVIIGLPDIRVHRLIHRIPSYFDTPDPN